MKFECTDVGNMERFIAHHQNKLRYVPERKSWVVWDGGKWSHHKEAEVFQMALDTTRSIYDEAKICEIDEGRKKLTNWAYSSSSNHRINTMLTMSQRHKSLVTSINEFDRDKTKINCLNGIVDLKTGEITRQTPSDLVMKQMPVAYQRHARSPKFNKFLHDIFNGDTELIQYIQRALGYTITGQTNEQKFFIAYGTGANGKSTLFETILHVLGDYGRAAEFDTFLSQDYSNTRVMEGIAKLMGIRFALASETDSTRRFSEGLIKRVSGGDTLTGSHLYGSSFEFIPEFKLWLQANHVPMAKDGSHGFWRRVQVLPFARKFNKTEIDQSLPQRLLDEKTGVLAWLVRGAMGWFKHSELNHNSSGLGRCAAVEEATAVYRSDHDLFGQFMLDCLEDSPGETVAAGDLYEIYTNWCQDKGDQYPCGINIFGSRLQERGVQKKRKNTGIVYLDKILKDNKYTVSDF